MRASAGPPGSFSVAGVGISTSVGACADLGERCRGRRLIAAATVCDVASSCLIVSRPSPHPDSRWNPKSLSESDCPRRAGTLPGRPPQAASSRVHTHGVRLPRSAGGCGAAAQSLRRLMRLRRFLFLPSCLLRPCFTTRARAVARGQARKQPGERAQRRGRIRNEPLLPREGGH